MKKIYNAPEADLLCFRPVEGLAAELDFNTMLNIQNGSATGGKGAAAGVSDTDIKITIGG